MTKLIQGLLCAAMIVVCAPGAHASQAEPLRLVTDEYLGDLEQTADDKAPGFTVEVVRQVFAAMGQVASIEPLPTNRAWRMIFRSERDGMFTTPRTSERERLCSFPDEPLTWSRWVVFIRSADVGKLKFSSFDDLIGHDVAVREPVVGVFEQPSAPPELWKFLREHHSLVETSSSVVSFRMLAANRVDYAVAGLNFGTTEIVKMGLSGKLEPILSPSATDDGGYVCFSRARVSPALVDAFSQALKQFKQTDTYRAIYQKYFP